MAKERMLTVLVPIKDSDATVVTSLPAVTPDNINVIYKHEGVYKRIWLNPATNQYEYHEVVDREFPYIGKPLEIFDFTYDATRMGTAPTITAQGVMWYADKDEDNNDVALEDLWLARNNDCHVSFNGENFYLKQVPTCSKDNGDARYKYDIDFISERVVLEHVYLYDVVQPFITEKPISESAEFSFFGDVNELAKRINASLLRSGLAHFRFRDGVTGNSYLTYSEFNSVGLGTYTGQKDTSDPYPIVTDSTGQSIIHQKHDNIYEHFGGDYNKYLLNLVYEVDNPKYKHIGPQDSGYDEIYDGEFYISGYVCKIGKDKKGELTTSEEKLISFGNNTIHEALQQVHDTFELQYYIYSEKDENGDFTGNTIIMIADCEHDFADVTGTDAEGNPIYLRDVGGIPTTEHPFDYGVDKELLFKEKANTTDKIITRITGTGGEGNIPWYYPNPTADGWIEPVYRRGGNDFPSIIVDYPKSEGSTVQESVTYEKFLKNRLGHIFNHKRLDNVISQNGYAETPSGFFFTDEDYDREPDGIVARYILDLRSENEPKVTINLNTTTDSNCTRITASVAEMTGDGWKYDSEENYLNPSEFQKAFMSRDGFNCFSLEGGRVYSLYISFYISSIPISRVYDFEGYYYPHEIDRVSGKETAYIFDNFYKESGLMLTVYRGGSGNVTEAGYCKEDEWWEHKYMKPIQRVSGSQYKDESTGVIYLCKTSGNGVWTTDSGTDDSFGIGYEDNPSMGYEEWLETCVDLKIRIYECDGWYINNKRVKSELSDYGMSIPSSVAPGFYDTIEFRRLKYITPQQKLMPQVYVKTDGERRYYVAHNYDPVRGEPSDVDEMVGEEYVNRTSQSGVTQMGIINTLYSEDGEGLRHYDFENEYIQGLPKEHIEEFDDVKPTIKGQLNTITVGAETKQIRIDVIEEFAYDELDSDEVWESNEDGNVQGEYKHPYFFAKLRPLGFNIFDLALQDDMVLSMTTGHCGACNFKIGVDENTKKNPLQIWENDVYYKDGGGYVLKYPAGSLRRYINRTSHYYLIDGVYKTISEVEFDSAKESLALPVEDSAPVRLRSYIRPVYEASQYKNGEVGALKQDNKTHAEGDVIYSGRFIESQQDTTDNYVWVALMKDTDSYGTIMPSARPDYADGNLSVYIRPLSISDVHTDTSTDIEDEENADKFVFTNIRLPQVYLRRAEKELSRKLIRYMYDNNYQKFNFSIGFSRIFLTENDDIDRHLNENSVLYVSFNRRTYRQYVKHYTYKMSEGEPLPEISVEMNEELSVSRTKVEQERADRIQESLVERRRIDENIKLFKENFGKKFVGRADDTLISGNIMSRDASTSMLELGSASAQNTQRISDTEVNLETNHYKKSDFVYGEKNLMIGSEIKVPTSVEFSNFVTSVNAFNSGAADRIKQIRTTVEKRLLPIAKDVQVDDDCVDVSKYYFNPEISSPNVEAKLWYDADGSEQTFNTTQSACPADQGMTDITWSDFDIP